MENSIFLDTINGIKTERPPVWFMRQAGRVLPSYMKLREKYTFHEMMADPKLAAEVTLLPIHDLGVDAAILFSDILVIPNAMGMELEFTAKGPVFKNPLKDASNPLELLKPDASKLEYIYAAIDEIIKTRPDNIPLIGFCGAPLTVLCYMVQGISSNHTFPDAIKLLYQDRKTAVKIIDAITELSIEYAVNQVKHGIDAFQLFETHAGLIPVELYDELFMPAIKKITAAVKATGTPVIFFPKGIGTGLSLITKEICDFVSIDWQMPIETARKLVDKEVGLQGNIDPRLLLADKSVIAKELEKYVEFGSKETKWIFNLGHGFLPQIPYENAKFLADWVKTTDWKR